MELKSWNDSSFGGFEKLIQYVLNYSEEKPNLENFSLEFDVSKSPIPLLSSVHQFVNNNFNLKSLSLNGVILGTEEYEDYEEYEDVRTEEYEQKMTEELIKIISCNHSLEEFELDCKSRNDRDKYFKDLLTKRFWKADEFPELIEKLEKSLE